MAVFHIQLEFLAPHDCSLLRHVGQFAVACFVLDIQSPKQGSGIDHF